ncbi:MAG TPA: translation initiation factor IF-3 [Fimbriimonadaceae bacterium]|nr:translation initiation factor IF-3 [Fimbriimonadaceae bacterium]HRJ97291.1 translation initiation factor IF-3 [Fimbriimonadaceae bacterium]
MAGFRRPPQRDEGPPVNERCLRFRDVRVIGADGDQVGIIQSRQALTMARELGLDLVMVSPQAQPPVCKIIDYGKFKYLTEKQEKEKKRTKQEVKGIKMRPGTAANDLNTLARNARKFLDEGHKVKVTCQFRAREVTHPEIGVRKMEAFAAQLADVSTIERPPSLDGRLMIMILLPKPSTGGKKKDAKDQNEQDGGQTVQDHGIGEDNPPEGL